METSLCWKFPFKLMFLLSTVMSAAHGSKFTVLLLSDAELKPDFFPHADRQQVSLAQVLAAVGFFCVSSLLCS